MVKKYVEELTELFKKINYSKKGISIEIKHFFSGAAVYANNKICMTLTPVGLAIKVPKKLRNKLLKEKGTKKLKYFPSAPIKKDYVVLSKTLFNDLMTLKNLVKESIAYSISIKEINQ